MPTMLIEVLECARCHYKWQPKRRGVEPKNCPKCGNDWRTTAKRPPIAEQRAASRALNCLKQTIEDVASTKKVAVEVVTDDVKNFLRAQGAKVASLEVGASGGSRYVPLIMNFSPTDDEDAEKWQLLKEGSKKLRIDVSDDLFECATPGSFAAQAGEWSLCQGHQISKVNEGDWLLLTPIDEFGFAIKPGDFLLAKICYPNGDFHCAFYEYAGKKLRVNQPEFAAADFETGAATVEVKAIFRGVLGHSWKAR